MTRRAFRARVFPGAIDIDLGKTVGEIAQDMLELQSVLQGYDEAITGLESADASQLSGLITVVNGGITVVGNLAPRVIPSISGTDLVLVNQPILGTYGVNVMSNQPGAETLYFVQSLSASILQLTARTWAGAVVDLSAGNHTLSLILVLHG